MYILGLLQRFGPQHGYQIKKIIAEELADFTHIKLPTIYYHLEKMERDGLLSASREKTDGRPEKTIYTVTELGKDAFRKMLAGLLSFEYRPIFPSDGIFYFSDQIQTKEIAGSLESYVGNLSGALAAIEKHRSETLAFLPEEAITMAEIIFEHHERHYQAELDWAKKTLKRLS